MREPIDFEDGFLEGVAAVRDAIKQHIKDNDSFWQSCSVDDILEFIDDLEVEVPNV